MATVAAGNLKTRVQLQRKTSSGVDAANRPIVAWETIWTTRAEVKDLGGREIEQARSMYPLATTRVTVRTAPPNFAVSTAHRWKTDDGRILNIGHRDYDPDNRLIVTLCGQHGADQ